MKISSKLSENNSDTDRDPSDAFIITIKTDNPGTSNDDQFTLPWIGTYDVDWGDGNTETSACRYSNSHLCFCWHL